MKSYNIFNSYFSQQFFNHFVPSTAIKPLSHNRATECEIIRKRKHYSAVRTIKEDEIRRPWIMINHEFFMKTREAR